MERLCHSSIHSQQILTSDNLLKYQRSFDTFLELRSRYVRIITGKETGTRIKYWHVVLVDCDKYEQFLHINTNHVDCTDYGRILISGYGDVPKELEDISVSNLVKDILVTNHPESNDEILYVLSESGKKQEIMEAKSIEEIECHGTVLYTATFLEPHEFVSFSIFKQLFLIKGKLDNLESTHNETTEDIFDVNCTYENGSTLLQQASYFGHVSFIKNLVGKGADIHKKDMVCGRLAAHIAAMQGNVGVLEFYLNNGIKINETDANGWTLFHYALWNENLQAIRFLILNGSEMNARDKCLGKTPLHVAAAEGHTEAIQVLLENGALIDKHDYYGRTPLYYSSMGDYLETAKVLIKSGANIHIANKSGLKPLHVATQEGNKDMVEFLLGEGSHIDNQTHSGDSALHFGAYKGLSDIVLLLVDNGANVNLVNINGETPFDSGKKHMDVASYLAIKMIKIFETQGNLEDAFKISNELLNIHGNKLGSDHFETLDGIFKLAKLLYEKGQYRKALDILTNINAKIFIGDEHVVLKAKCELQLSIGEVYVKYKKTVEGLNGVFKKWEADLGVDNSNSLTDACEAARKHLKKCEYDETFIVLRNALGYKDNSVDSDEIDSHRDC